MTNFLQFHVLTTYPAANLNRDDTGRPKTLHFGGVERLRVSSQSLKRAMRTSADFAAALHGAIGTRSNTFTDALVAALRQRQMPDDEITKRVGKVIEKDKLGKPKKESALHTEQLVHLGPEELARLEALADRLVASDELADKDAVVLVQKPKAADIALFGRMLADNPGYNVEAAAQVAHAFTTHKVSVEDDFYTAVDDLKSADRDADRGAGFIGVTEYGAGVFYLYVCVDVNLLVANLAGDKALATTTLEAFVDALTMVSPKGKQNSFASRAYASFALAELGTRTPRSLAAAFLRPIGTYGDGNVDYGVASRKALLDKRKTFDEVYGQCWTKAAHLDVLVDDATTDSGSLAALKALAWEAVDGVA
jgi:CRISPR system Cascade subunit CasC